MFSHVCVMFVEPVVVTVCLCVYVHAYVCMHVCVCVACECMWVSACVCIRMCACICVCVCVCVWVRVYVEVLAFSTEWMSVLFTRLKKQAPPHKHARACVCWGACFFNRVNEYIIQNSKALITGAVLFAKLYNININ